MSAPWIWEGMRYKFRAATKPSETLYRIDGFKLIEGAAPPAARVHASAIRRDGQLHAQRVGYSGILIKGSFIEQPDVEKR